MFLLNHRLRKIISKTHWAFFPAKHNFEATQLEFWFTIIPGEQKYQQAEAEKSTTAKVQSDTSRSHPLSLLFSFAQFSSVTSSFFSQSEQLTQTLFWSSSVISLSLFLVCIPAAVFCVPGVISCRNDADLAELAAQLLHFKNHCLLLGMILK